MAQPIKYEQLLLTEPLSHLHKHVGSRCLVSALRQRPAYVRRLSVTQSFPEFLTEF